MAEPHRASSLPDSSHLSRRARPPSRYTAPPEFPLDETQDLSPSAQLADPLSPVEPEIAAGPAWARRGSRAWRLAVSSRSPGEWMLMAVLLCGLALNALFVLTNAALPPADRLLGSAVFLVGIALLVLVEIGRRSGTTSR